MYAEMKRSEMKIICSTDKYKGRIANLTLLMLRISLIVQAQLSISYETSLDFKPKTKVGNF